MTTVTIQNIDGAQSVVLPSEFRFDVDAVTIRKEGEAVILEPVKGSRWPEGFFEAIQVEDERFVRPDQGTMPAAPAVSTNDPG